jgi:hypothetical protein
MELPASGTSLIRTSPVTWREHGGEQALRIRRAPSGKATLGSWCEVSARCSKAGPFSVAGLWTPRLRPTKDCKQRPWATSPPGQETLERQAQHKRASTHGESSIVVGTGTSKSRGLLTAEPRLTASLGPALIGQFVQLSSGREVAWRCAGIFRKQIRRRNSSRSCQTSEVLRQSRRVAYWTKGQ